MFRLGLVCPATDKDAKLFVPLFRNGESIDSQGVFASNHCSRPLPSFFTDDGL